MDFVTKMRPSAFIYYLMHYITKIYASFNSASARSICLGERIFNAKNHGHCVHLCINIFSARKTDQTNGFNLVML